LIKETKLGFALKLMLFRNKITTKPKLEIKWKYRYSSISKAANYNFWRLVMEGTVLFRGTISWYLMMSSHF